MESFYGTFGATFLSVTGNAFWYQETELLTNIHCESNKAKGGYYREEKIVSGYSINFEFSSGI